MDHQRSRPAFTDYKPSVHIHSNTTMVKALLNYPSLSFICQPATASSPHHPDEPYLAFSLPLPAWGQGNVIRRSLEERDGTYKLTPVGHAVSDGRKEMAQELLAVRTFVCIRETDGLLPHAHLPNTQHHTHTGRRRPDIHGAAVRLLLQRGRGRADAGGAGQGQGPPRAALDARGKGGSVVLLCFRGGLCDVFV